MADNMTEMTDEQLVEKLRTRERELVAARFTHSMNQLENTASLRVIRKDIARLKSAARTRELAQGLQKGSLIATHRAPSETEAAAAQAAPAAKRGGFLKGIVDKLTTKE
jgi:large subunit ribosomal protein L29